ncbi:hypothetical protein O1L68_22060 [Streptomyces lydicus]|nr:hypothetical protein [Streptomyces lydicus]
MGRLRLRIGSSTITYRGTLTVSAAAEDGGSGDGGTGDGGPDDRRTGGDGAGDGGAADVVTVVTVEAKGTETRGEGSVALTLTVRLSPATEPGPGTTLACSGTVHGDGRLAEASGQSALTAGPSAAGPLRGEPDGRSAAASGGGADRRRPFGRGAAGPGSSAPRCRRRPWARQ